MTTQQTQRLWLVQIRKKVLFLLSKIGVIFTPFFMLFFTSLDVKSGIKSCFWTSILKAFSCVLRHFHPFGI